MQLHYHLKGFNFSSFFQNVNCVEYKIKFYWYLGESDIKQENEQTQRKREKLKRKGKQLGYEYTL
jgi:hypothetical protein